MHLLHAVRGPLPFKVVPLHHARVAAALCQARDIDFLHAFQRLNRDLAAHRDLDVFYLYLGFFFLGLFAFRGWGGFLYDLPHAGSAQLADESLRLATGLVGHLHAGSTELLGSLAFELGNMTTFTAAR